MDIMETKREKRHKKKHNLEENLNSSQEKLNNFHDKIENKVTNCSEEYDSINLNINSNNNQKSFNKEVSFKGSPIGKRLRARNKKPSVGSSLVLSSESNHCSTLTDESKWKTRNHPLKRAQSKKCKYDNKPKEIESIGLNKINYDIKIDPNVQDHYTNKPVELMPGVVMPSPESPETKRRRIEEENMVVARQCRLHPANKKYNQGPVVNPPLISPGTRVGYTPAGQRHEVDLNFERPTWFNSEYARMQFDDATRINVSRMFHDLETGMFLPDGLDADVERRYFAEQKLVTEEATKHFETCSSNSNDLNVELTDSGECMSLLESEEQLLKLNEFAVVRIQDFPAEVAKTFKSALSLNLTPLMIKKNPCVVETLEKLASQSIYSEVVKPARDLLYKIKGLFDVPESQTFHEFLASEVEILKERTKHMTSFDIFIMTQEPPVESSLGYKEEVGQDPTPIEESSQTSEPEDEWIPVQNGEYWVDTNENDNEEIDWRSNNENGEFLDSESDDDDAWTTTYLSDIQSDTDDENDDVVLDTIHGMIFQGLPDYIVLSFFEYI